jgi:hypothetical protein
MSTRQESTAPPPSATGSRPRQRLELAEIGIRLLDEALQAWYDGPPRAATDLYLSYRAALDREHAAAGDLERLWELARSGHEALAAASQLAGDQSS